MGFAGDDFKLYGPIIRERKGESIEITVA